MDKIDKKILGYFYNEYKKTDSLRVPTTSLVLTLGITDKEKEDSLKRLIEGGYCEVHAKGGDKWIVIIKILEKGIVEGEKIKFAQLSLEEQIELGRSKKNDIQNRTQGIVPLSQKAFSPYRYNMIQSDTLLILKLILLSCTQKKKHASFFDLISTSLLLGRIICLKERIWNFSGNHPRSILQELIAIFTHYGIECVTATFEDRLVNKKWGKFKWDNNQDIDHARSLGETSVTYEKFITTFPNSF